MKKLLIPFLLLFFAFAVSMFGQITNLQVKGVSSDFTIASGDDVSWSYDVPNPGDTTFCNFWIDANNNKMLDSADVDWTYFNQIDGDTEGHNGPPDMDGVANGHVSFQQKVGLAPGHYILTFNNNGSLIGIPGTVTPLNSAAFTITGHVTVPSGVNKENIVLQIESNSNNGSGTFWSALTDNNGDYSIQMDADTTGNPWKLSINNSFIFKSAIVSPQNIRITLDPSVANQYTGNNFTISAASASITGTVKDGSGEAVVDANVYISNNNGSFESDANSDLDGKYFIGLSSNDLPKTNLNISTWMDSSFIQFNYNIPSISAGDNIVHDIYLFKINSIIKGRLTWNGSVPGITEVFASCANTGFIRTTTDNNGYFEFKVSDKINDYTISISYVPQGYINDSIIVHPGDTTANLNLTMTDVKQPGSNVPKEYSLLQNYPNPFNPSTLIKYEIPKSSFVSLKIFDILGNEVETLVNGTMNAGSYEVKFDGSKLSSGIYLYQLRANNYTATKKFLLLK